MHWGQPARYFGGHSAEQILTSVAQTRIAEMVNTALCGENIPTVKTNPRAISGGYGSATNSMSV
jgi:hypothetical protein